MSFNVILAFEAYFFINPRRISISPSLVVDFVAVALHTLKEYFVFYTRLLYEEYTSNNGYDHFPVHTG